jgi:hypothetical protein
MDQPTLNALQWSAAIISVLGAWCVGARAADARRVGFALFLASNVLWLAYGLATRQWGIVLMQAAFTVTSIRGTITTWSAP